MAEEIEVIFLSETTNGILLKENGSDDQTWFPKSQIDWDDGAYDEGEIVDIEIPMWLLQEKGWR
jgi:hypothetical protein